MQNTILRLQAMEADAADPDVQLISGGSCLFASCKDVAKPDVPIEATD